MKSKGWKGRSKDQKKKGGVLFVRSWKYNEHGAPRRECPGQVNRPVTGSRAVGKTHTTDDPSIFHKSNE
jgi:hypothetical protein